MKLSIRNVLIIGCILLVWGTHLAMTPTSFFSTEKVLLKHAQDIMLNILDLSKEQASNHLSLAQSATHLTEKLLEKQVVGSQIDNIRKLEHYFLDQLSIYSHFAGIYLGKPDGSFYYVSRSDKHAENGYRTKLITYQDNIRHTRYAWRNRMQEVVFEDEDPADLYDPRKRPWYKKVLKNKKIVWTDPYIFFTSRKPGITIAGPVYKKDGTLMGVVGVDIELEELSLFLSKLRIGKSGRAFMLNRNGDVVAFPDLDKLRYHPKDQPDAIRLPKIYEISDPIAANASKAILGDPKDGIELKLEKESFGKFQYGDQNYLTMFAPFSAEEWPWVIGVYVPEEDYLGEIRDNRNFEILITILFSLIATVAALVLARSISKPIGQLEKTVNEFKDQKFDSDLTIKTPYHELKTTASAFNDMKKSILNYQEVLQSKEQVHRAITSSVSDGIIMQDYNGTVTFWNPEAEKLFGYPSDQATGKSLYQLAVDNTDSSNSCKMLEEDLQIIKNLHRSAGGEKNLELRICHPERGVLTVEISRASIMLQAMDYTISLIRDVTERKKAEKEKEVMSNKLRQSQKMEAIGLMAGGVAHDLNNILSGVVGYPELLTHMVHDEEVLEGLRVIETSGKKAAAVVSDLLTVARGAASQKSVRNINVLIQNYLESPEYKKLKKFHPGVHIQLELDDDIKSVLCSMVHVEKVIMNLVGNAAEAIESVGIISIETRELNLSSARQIENLYLAPGEYVEVKVIDDGPGIDPKDLDRIFEPFYTKKVMGRSGTGLGLSVVWNTMQDHEGAVHVESSHMGTTFTLYFPVTDKSEAKNIKPKDLEALKGNENILVLEDDALQRVVTRKLLSRLGYAVRTVENLEEALEELGKEPADLLILDMLLGDGTSGYKVYQKILDEYPGQKAIIASGYAENDEVKGAQKLGAGAFVKKPFTLEEIGQAIYEELHGQKTT